MKAFRRAETARDVRHLTMTPARGRTLAEVDDGGAWEWHAELEDGADVTSLPFATFARAALDALGHGLGFAASHREAFRSLSVRRVTPRRATPEAAH